MIAVTQTVLDRAVVKAVQSFSFDMAIEQAVNKFILQSCAVDKIATRTLNTFSLYSTCGNAGQERG